MRFAAPASVDAPHQLETTEHTFKSKVTSTDYDIASILENTDSGLAGLVWALGVESCSWGDVLLGYCSIEMVVLYLRICLDFMSDWGINHNIFEAIHKIAVAMSMLRSWSHIHSIETRD